MQLITLFQASPVAAAAKRSQVQRVQVSTRPTLIAPELLQAVSGGKGTTPPVATPTAPGRNW